MNLKEELSLMWKFYTRAGLSPFTNLTFSVLVLYFLAIGFSTTLTGFIYAASTLFIVLFEIPTGVVADVFGRKLSVCIGILLNALSIFILFLTANPLIVLISFVIASIGYTFISGADDAWFVDYFLHNGDKKSLSRVISRRKSIFSFMSFIVHFFASLILILFKYDYGLITVVRAMFIIESSVMLLCFIIAFFTEEPYFKKKSFKNYFKDTIDEARITVKKSLKEITSNKRLFFIFIACMILFFGSTSTSLGWNVQLNNNGVDESFLGVLLGIAYLLSFITLSFNERITKKIGVKKAITYSVALLAVTIMVFSFNLGLWLIPVYLLFAGMLWDFWENNISIRMNELIPRKIRATVLSLKSFANFLPTMLGEVLLFGLVTDLFNISTSILVGSLFFFTSIFFFNKI
ncbi:MAG: MFS transporter [Nanoarchaeota archaeon]|nr:MFS transporter [Nanoarchaeota archaeon]